MSCKTLERYAYLSRPGELTRAEAEQWRAHRHTCPACQALADEIAVRQTEYAALRSTVPPGAPPATQVILGRIAALEGRSWQRFVVPFAQPQLQWLQAAAVLLLCSLFVWQTWLTPAALQEVHQPPAPALTLPALSPGLRDWAALRQHRNCLEQVREWTRQEGWPGVQQPDPARVLLRRSDPRIDTRQLTRLLADCGWRPEDLDYLLRHRTELMSILING